MSAPSEQPTERAVLQLVEEQLHARLEQTCRSWRTLTPASARDLLGIDLVRELSEFTLTGGKRVRPHLCYWGWVAGGAGFGLEDVVDASVALELLHSFGLAQDDVMDSSTLRRGRRTLHLRFADQHRGGTGRSSDSARFGESLAILVSDLALTEMYSVVMQLPEAMRERWQAMMIELVSGQSLDLIGAAIGGVDLESARHIAQAKSGHYTVTRPLQLGACAAGAGPACLNALEQFGSHVGLAFALRDDLISLTGDPETTGKPVGEDLRDAKPTVLRALTHTAGIELPPPGAPLTCRQTDEVVSTMSRRGVIDRVEELISQELVSAETIISSGALDPAAADGLRSWARRLAWRHD